MWWNICLLDTIMATVAKGFPAPQIRPVQIRPSSTVLSKMGLPLTTNDHWHYCCATTLFMHGVSHACTFMNVMLVPARTLGARTISSSWHSGLVTTILSSSQPFPPHSPSLSTTQNPAISGSIQGALQCCHPSGGHLTTYLPSPGEGALAPLPFSLPCNDCSIASGFTLRLFPPLPAAFAIRSSFRAQF